MIRTHNNNQLTLKDLNKKVILQGYIDKIRKLGKKIFVDLRDMYGITQILFEDDLVDEAMLLKNEYVVQVDGVVLKRLSANPGLVTGEVEVKCKKLQIISKSILTPFEIKDDLDASEETRMKYRYLDLRRPLIQKNFIFKSQIYKITRNFFYENEFIEIPTPILGKATPEGARDFVVPSRLNKGKWYALPQSPQLYKQLFMVSGFDRYFQIARTFRDEDLRNDRQLEFDQLDLEMSFAKQEDVIFIIDTYIKELFLKALNYKIENIPHISFSDSIEKYGCDKPDIRYDLYLHTLNDIFKDSQFPIFKDTNKSIRSIAVKYLLSKKEIEACEEISKQNHCQFFSFVKITNKEWSGPLASKLSDKEKASLINKFKVKDNGTIIIAHDEYLKVSAALSGIRTKLAKDYKLYDENSFKPCFIVDFPLFEFSEEENRYVSAHNPFTMPSQKYIDNFENNKPEAMAASYDLVINGYEMGSGAERITDQEIQKRMFKAIDMDNEEIENNFGWFINAYKYGAPYHAGMGIGIDRLIMVMTKSDSIREIISFPKNSKGICAMTNAPSEIDDQEFKDTFPSLPKNNNIIFK
ncbi:aspartate--tRNA ligase [Spiroplasma endosymbiont of Aspidapion aeneum]|uniref:aspartate--tRNA ligase n=1 Tax=Spiroplasma endosymbiont of Aspidapion aeneum TaxID=3066276 RepID=UPI00313D184B